MTFKQIRKAKCKDSFIDQIGQNTELAVTTNLQ
jgi:hypothetical protein